MGKFKVRLVWWIRKILRVNDEEYEFEKTVAELAMKYKLYVFPTKIEEFIKDTRKMCWSSLSEIEAGNVELYVDFKELFQAKDTGMFKEYMLPC
jgi:hypothetical protein